MVDEELLRKIDEIVEKRRNPNYHIAGINLSAIIQGLIVIGIVGLYAKIDSNTTRSIQRQVQIENIFDDIVDIKKSIEKNNIRLDNFRAMPYYTREDLQADLEPINKKLNSIETDVHTLKGKVDKIQ